MGAKTAALLHRHVPNPNLTFVPLGHHFVDKTPLTLTQYMLSPLCQGPSLPPSLEPRLLSLSQCFARPPSADLTASSWAINCNFPTQTRGRPTIHRRICRYSIAWTLIHDSNWFFAPLPSPD